MSERKDNSGALFRNDTEGKSENFPTHGGSAMIGGVEYYISAWVKEGKSGKFFSLAFKPKGEKSGKPAKAPAKDDDFVDDPLPF